MSNKIPEVSQIPKGETSHPLNALRDLLSLHRRHIKYTGTQYVAYCKQIRNLTEHFSGARDEIKDVIDFFEKQFVEEMEILGRICARLFASQLDEIQAQYVLNDPPDGIITLPDDEQIFIECSSSKDRRWEAFALEQQRKHGRIVSISGFEGSDISGSRNSRYFVKGLSVDDPESEEYLVEVDDQITVIDRQRRHIGDKLKRKVNKDWPDRRNWLSIVVNEYAIIGQSYNVMGPTLLELFERHRDELRKKHVEALIFIGNRIDETGWFSFHRT